MIAPVKDMTVDGLQQLVLRAVMISMSMTGEWKTLAGHDFYNHDDYDAAMAATLELSRRAKKGEA